MDDAVTLRDSGIVDLDGEEVYVKRVNVAIKAEWIIQKEKTKGDLRLLGHFRNAGKRYLDFKDPKGCARVPPSLS